MRRTLGGLSFVVLLLSTGAMSQPAVPTHIALMPMANGSNPADLDFQGGSCDITSNGEGLACSFQQVFLSPVPEDPATCRIVTNRYEQSFKKQDERRWVSVDPPQGPCGQTTVTTIERDEKSLAAFWRVAITIKRVATAGGTQCAVDDLPETLRSTSDRRPLGCTFVVAASLE